MTVEFGDSRLPSRFWDRVRVNDDTGCWEWTGSTNGVYGNWTWKAIGIRGNISTHRAAYRFLVAEIPEGGVVRHKCDVPLCVNPDHLELGTHKDNVRDKMSRGRHKTNGNDRKTHCKRGHKFTPENTMKGPRGVGRRCRTCHYETCRVNGAKYRAKKRAERESE